ncbi:CXADR-like membrane protein [Chanos chanos]|uniref:CXADR-like membrane protein n=1 Tax=Chanos chanos TaxID=29144 RepID=A0A6J2ULX5_CHACN|nr:CXADR-like membrane protein [Chanos chanos]
MDKLLGSVRDPLLKKAVIRQIVGLDGSWREPLHHWHHASTCLAGLQINVYQVGGIVCPTYLLVPLTPGDPASRKSPSTPFCNATGAARWSPSKLALQPCGTINLTTMLSDYRIVNQASLSLCLPLVHVFCLSFFLLVLLSLLSAGAQTEMKRVVGDNTTLPCHHQFWQSSGQSLDIEWLLQKPNIKQHVIITFFGNEVYTTQANRLSFAGDYLKGDASLLISDLQLTDSGEYHCKVKTGGKYHWSQVNLLVLVKPSKPRCWMEGRLLEGSDVKLSCKSSDGSEPIRYKWERVLDKGKSVGKLPPLALIDLKNPEIVTLRNLTQDSSGEYKCTAMNDVGEEHCLIEVTMQHVRSMGVVAGAVVGVSFGVLLIILIIWLVFRKKEKKKYEEEETPNEIREDAEAPKAKLVKPNSLSSSRSGSSRSGTSSTQSMVHNSAPRGPHPHPRPPAIAALKENGQPAGFPQSPPSYTQVVSKTPEPPATPKFRPPNPPVGLAVPGGGVIVPAQSKAFQTV